jgi:catechol 2,3-dioxygenase-like lactoylglutathione lyase family enzyme
MTNRNLKVQPIDHITLVVADLEATRDFYVNILGMEEVPRPAFDFPGAWFQAGSTQIHATVSDEHSGLAGWADRSVGKLSRGHHFAFAVEDAVAAAQFLTDKGIEIKDGPKHRPDGPTQIYFHDPDGHLVELFST